MFQCSKKFYRRLKNQFIKQTKFSCIITSIDKTSIKSFFSSLKKIKINNQIRNILNSKIALLELTSGNTEQKIKAIYGIINEGDLEILIIINELLSKEKDKELIFS